MDGYSSLQNSNWPVLYNIDCDNMFGPFYEGIAVISMMCLEAKFVNIKIRTMNQELNN